MKKTGYFDFAVSRAYYAMFYPAEASVGKGPRLLKALGCPRSLRRALRSDRSRAYPPDCTFLHHMHKRRCRLRVRKGLLIPTHFSLDKRDEIG